MNICTGIPQKGMCCGSSTTATLGTFDGVHLAHRHILEKVLERARKTDTRSAVITFDRHPAAVLHPELAPKLLTTLDEKLTLFEEIGIDTVYVIPFTKETASMNPEKFIAGFLVDCLGIRYFIVGYDHGFGKDRGGSADMLEKMAAEFGFTLEIQPPIRIHDHIINSSEIRRLIADGDLKRANSFLGRVYSIEGNVVHGQGIGSKLGIPTANVDPVNADKILPRHGVYAGLITIADKQFDAVVNVGPRPTFNNDEVSIEAHIPGYSGSLYEKTLRLGFSHRIRDIRTFATKEDLVDQIKNDIETMKQKIPL